MSEPREPTTADGDAARISTAPPEDGDPAGSGTFGGLREPGWRGALAWTGREALGWARWMWRQLTSMRVALILLFLLALATIPGSLVPQESRDPVLVAEFRQENETLGALYDRLQLFEVFSSVWFSAIYILLFVSLIGCIIPRSWQFVGQLRGRPPRAPRRLDRMPAYTTWHTDADPAEALDTAHAELRRRRFRADRHGPGERRADGAGTVAAEKGYLREAGNLVFHVALIVMLVAFAASQLYRTEGGKLVLVGDGFTNTLTQYDDFSSGVLYDVDDLERFTFDLNDFHADFIREGPDLGTPREFHASLTYWQDGDEEGTDVQLEVNDPLTIGDAKVFLTGHGFAPRVTVTDPEGETAFAGPVPFLPQDEALSSTGVVKVTDYRGPDGEFEQLGFQGFFNPTFMLTEERGPHSTFPEPDYPVLTLNAYHGDLGLDRGVPQNVYQLDSSRMEQFTDDDGEPVRVNLQPGDVWELPEDRGTLTFEGYDRWVTFEISTPMGNGWALTGAIASVLGLAASLLLQRRRVWVRATVETDGRTRIEMASLGRSESARVPEELGELADRLTSVAPMLPERRDPAPDGPDGPEETGGTGGPGSGSGSGGPGSGGNDGGPASGDDPGRDGGFPPDGDHNSDQDGDQDGQDGSDPGDGREPGGDPGAHSDSEDSGKGTVS